MEDWEADARRAIRAVNIIMAVVIFAALAAAIALVLI